jgi:transposase InsO family protein
MLSKWRKQIRDGELAGRAPPIEAQAVSELQRLREVEQQFKRLQMEHDLLKKVHPVCLRTEGEVFAFLAANRKTHPLQMMCELYGVTRAGIYARQQRQPSVRSQEDAQLAEHVRTVHARSRGFYGSPRVRGQLQLDGVAVGPRRVARLMREAGLQGRSARLYRQPKVARRAFHAAIPYRKESASTQAPDQVWVGDVTYLKVAGEWRYMAAVMDRHSRRIVGWSLSDRRDAALTMQALRQSARKRQPGPGVVFHSDRGIEYAATEYREQLLRLGMLQSRNRAGKMNDNAHMESFFHSMKCEELYGKTFDNEGELRRARAAMSRSITASACIRHCVTSRRQPSSCGTYRNAVSIKAEQVPAQRRSIASLRSSPPVAGQLQR